MMNAIVRPFYVSREDRTDGVWYRLVLGDIICGWMIEEDFKNLIADFMNLASGNMRDDPFVRFPQMYATWTQEEERWGGAYLNLKKMVKSGL